jgi:hypothetical protein
MNKFLFTLYCSKPWTVEIITIIYICRIEELSLFICRILHVLLIMKAPVIWCIFEFFSLLNWYRQCLMWKTKAKIFSYRKLKWTFLKGVSAGTQHPGTSAPIAPIQHLRHLFGTYSTYGTYSAPRVTLNMSTYSTCYHSQLFFQYLQMKFDD